MTEPPRERDLRALLKAHLHVHLEGAMRPETLGEFAERYGEKPNPLHAFGSFASFIDAYRLAAGLVRSADNLRRLVTEVVLDAAADGAVWIEPALLSSQHRPHIGPDSEVIGLVLDAGATAASAAGIGFGLLIAADRSASPAEAEAIARIAATRADSGVVSFGLAGDELSHPAEPFFRAFQIAADSGLISPPHAGEFSGAASVRSTLDQLGARRIQHGVRALGDPAVLCRLADDGICLDVCPTSNIALGVVPSWAQHPLPALLRAGIPCSVNADDPLLFGTSLLTEYELCRTKLGLSDRELATIARASLNHSGSPRTLVADANHRIDQWLSDEAAVAPDQEGIAQ